MGLKQKNLYCRRSRKSNEFMYIMRGKKNETVGGQEKSNEFMYIVKRRKNETGIWRIENDFE